MGEALRMGQDPKIEMVTRMMRLTRAANLPVGNPMIPTTSPAERRRLTAAELLASIFPVMVFDDLNAGEGGGGWGGGERKNVATWKGETSTIPTT